LLPNVFILFYLFCGSGVQEYSLTGFGLCEGFERPGNVYYCMRVGGIALIDFSLSY